MRTSHAEVKFDQVNTAAYSPRPNTPAALWDNQVGEPACRLTRLENACSLHLQWYSGYSNQVLVEYCSVCALPCVNECWFSFKPELVTVLSGPCYWLPCITEWPPSVNATSPCLPYAPQVAELIKMDRLQRINE